MNTKNILVTGANGQLGNEMYNVLHGNNNFVAFFTDVTPRDRFDVAYLDITDDIAVSQYVQENHIDCIVNCAAYTAVDAAEDNAVTARKLNTDAVGILAQAARAVNARMVQISTDYVFDGESHCTPLQEDMETRPMTVYGETKLDGENRLREILPADHIILRTAWLYSPYGKNFVKTMLNLGHTKPALKVVFDQVGTPTCAHDLALAIMTVLTAQQWHTGTYHFSNEGVISWFDFTRAIHRLAGITGCDVQPCHSDEFPAKAHRPAYSVLDKTKFKTTFHTTIPYWEPSLARTIEQILNQE